MSSRCPSPFAGIALYSALDHLVAVLSFGLRIDRSFDPDGPVAQPEVLG